MKILNGLILFYFCFLQGSLFSQPISDITYSAGTLIEVQTGADVCANTITVNGAFSGGGTFCSGLLPVTVSAFSANTKNNNVMLAWRTETELNNSGFEVERKETPINPPEVGSGEWVKIAFVRGNGTTSEPKNYSFADRKLQTGNYKYRLKQIDYNGSVEYFELTDDVKISAPADYRISQNYPNPSNPKSKIDFEIPLPGKVSVKVYDMLGKEVSVLVNELKDAGFYTAEFDGSNLASGVYFYRLSSGDFNFVKKMILVK